MRLVPPLLSVSSDWIFLPSVSLNLPSLFYPFCLPPSLLPPFLPSFLPSSLFSPPLSLPPSFLLSLSLSPQPPEIPVEEEDWFYGDIDRRLAESKCKKAGDYLVRYSTRAGKYVLTCNNNGAAKHFMIQVISGVSSLVDFEPEQ